MQVDAHTTALTPANAAALLAPYDLVLDCTEFGICRLPGSMNIPIKELVANPSQSVLGDEEDTETYVVCRLGNDSQLAVEALRNANARGTVKDVIGGLRAWAKEVDEAFPVY